ncbi:family with sequence similarity 120B [Nesidiocoris tenuis]|uniref:Family with sequence similarity 120B n=1 Tax=Nesidiocoris tenuis TaxID=355587 RepID=A0ABN7ANB8_9HEMI|nr:family with sequence similarity 120B [Nesidiocoris tenuis]
MGIPGLMSQVKRSRSCHKQVDIAREAEKVRSEGREPVVIVDMMACLRIMYGSLPWVPGGQTKEFVCEVEKFADRFKRVGIKLVFYIDGSLDEAKEEKWKKNKKSKIDIVQNIFDNMRRRSCGIGVGHIEVLPQNLGFTAVRALRRCGCEVIRSVGDCDLEIARYGCDEKCLAVLASDSDFIIFPGNWQFWALDDLCLDKMTTMAFDKSQFALNLGIDVRHFPILASLLGNDVIERHHLSTFHRAYKMAKNFPEATLVASFIRGAVAKSSEPDLEFVARKAFLTGRAKELFFKSVQSYDVETSVRDDPPSDDENWNAVCRMMRKRHIEGNPLEIYGSAVKGLYTYPHSLEEYRQRDEKPLPPNQQVTLTLRRKIYGILLFEKPPKGGEHYVRELVVTGPESLNRSFTPVSAIMPKTPHPGLRELWSASETYVGQRWALLCEPMGIDPDILHQSNVPPRLYALTLALKYLIDEKVDFQPQELAAIASSAVMVEHYSAQQIADMEVDLYPRPVQLATIVYQTCRLILTLNAACGYPINEDEADPVNFQDGKLFQRAFNKLMARPSKVEELCEKEKRWIKQCNAILDVLSAY